MPESEIIRIYRRRADRVAQLLAGLPFIRLVGLSGSLARGEAHPNSDIDFLVITAPGRLYTVRFLATFLVHFLGLRRYGTKIAGRICLNRYQTTNYLTIEPRNRYHAEDLSRLIPLVNIDQTYSAYQAANIWMADFGFTVYYPLRRASRSLRFSQYTRRAGEWGLTGWLGDRLEKSLKNFQQRKIIHNPLTKYYPNRILVADDRLLFHPPAPGEVDDIARWDAVSAEYDVLQGRLGDPFRRTILDPVLLELAGEVKDKQVLDAGAGNGYLTNRLAEAGARVMGIDVSITMVARASQNFPSRDFRRADLCQPLPLANAAFDLIVCSMVLHALADPLPVLRELRRVAQVDATFVVAIPHPAFVYPVGVADHSIIDRLLGRPSRLRITDYTTSRQVSVALAGVTIPTTRYHRPLEQYLAWCLAAGWELVAIREPTGRIIDQRHRRQLSLTEHIPFALVMKFRPKS